MFPVILIAVGAAVLAFGKRLAVLGAAVGALLGVVLLTLLPGSSDPLLGIIVYYPPDGSTSEDSKLTKPKLRDGGSLFGASGSDNSGFTFRVGKVTVKRLPSPGVLSSAMAPPSNSTIRCT